MAFDIFKKKSKKNGDDAPQAAPAAEADGAENAPDSEGDSKKNGHKRDPRKADAFFRHATTTADSRQYDYSIECYINGLRHEPDNMFRHEELFDVALKRHVSGGKKAGMLEHVKGGGRDPVDKMLHAEKMLAMDPRNAANMKTLMEKALDAHRADDDLDLTDFIVWIGEKAMEANLAAKKPSQDVFIKVRDIFNEIQQYPLAVQAGQYCVRMGDPDGKHLRALKDLEAENTMQKARYSEGARASQKDEEGQSQRNMEDATDLSAEQLKHLAQLQRDQYNEDRDEMPQLQKLVKTLNRMNSDEADKEAIDLLTEAYERTDGYHLKVQAGDVKMRQYRRHLQNLKKEAQKNPDDQSIRDRFKQIADERTEYELAEFKERVEKYPTDLGLKFQLGRRYLDQKNYDEAIALFQQAQADPKIRAHCSNFLGRCYISNGWYDEAIDTLKVGIETHPLADDALGLELRYQLMEAMEHQARKTKTIDLARQAQKMGAGILQTNINYRDIRQRVDNLRKLVDELQTTEA